jgi:tetratricopeptide (TPR) repeat protein
VIRLYIPKIILFLTLASFLLLAIQSTNTWALEKPKDSNCKGTRINKDIIKGIDLLYDNSFDDAENLFRKVIDESPDKPIGYFYLAMVTWSRMSSGFWSPNIVMEYNVRIDRAIEVAKSRIENNSTDCYDFFYLGGALGFKGRFELMQTKWFSSFTLAMKAVDALKTSQKMAPENRDILLGLGIFDYYTARLSGALKFISYLLIHRGDKEEGLRKLHVAANEAVYSATEAKSMLIHIYLFLEEDFTKAMKLSEELARKYRQNPRYRFFLGVCYIRLGMDREYRDTVNLLSQRSLQAKTLSEAGLWGKRALYLETVHDLFQKQYHDARAKLSVILNKKDSLNDPEMIAWPLMKIGMSYDLEGNRKEAVNYYQGVLNMENGSGAQFLAKKLLEDPLKQNDPFIGF